MKEACGIVGVYDFSAKKRNVTATAIRSLLELQHRGELCAGLSSYNPKRNRLIQTHKALGTIAEVFFLSNPERHAELVREYAGHAAIAHNRYATSGKADSQQCQPFERVHGRMWKWFSFGFNGNLANYETLKNELVAHGYNITYHSDTEVMMHCINRELRGEDPPPYRQLVANIARVFDGAFNIIYLNGVGELLAVRDPLGIKPLCYGIQDDLLVVASESVALTNLGFENFQDLPPGHLLLANKDGLKIEAYGEPKQVQNCFFEWIYFSHLASKMEGRSVYQVRWALGKALAEQETLAPVDDFIVVDVPSTAQTIASSFAFHKGLPYSRAMSRNRYIGRTFIDGVTRGQSVDLKYTPLPEALEGKKIFLLDDSLVRGTTMQRLIEVLRLRGKAKEIHVRIGNPPIMAPCFYGIDMPTLTELFAPRYFTPGEAANLTLDAQKPLAKILGADSFSYLSHEGLFQALGLPREQFCSACITTNYPTTQGKLNYQELLREARMRAQA